MGLNIRYIAHKTIRPEANTQNLVRPNTCGRVVTGFKNDFYLFHFIFQDKDANLGAAHEEEREEKSGEQGKIAFFCGNPMVEIIQGIIHIYKNK